MASKRQKKKGFTAADWPLPHSGPVNAFGFCSFHSSHFCPCAKPKMYGLHKPVQRGADPAPTQPVARNTDPDTSHQAAADAGTHAATNRALALKLLQEHGPMTDYELADLSGLQQNSIGKRRGELVQAGLVAATSLRRPNPETGSMCIVWEAVSWQE